MNDTSDPKQVSTLDIKQVTKLLPHRYPFLLIDRTVNKKVGANSIAEVLAILKEMKCS